MRRYTAVCNKRWRPLSFTHRAKIGSHGRVFRNDSPQFYNGLMRPTAVFSSSRQPQDAGRVGRRGCEHGLDIHWPISGAT